MTVHRPAIAQALDVTLDDRRWLFERCGRIDDYAYTQPVEHLKELAPKHQVVAAFDLARKVLADDADAAGSVVLPKTWRLASSAVDLAELKSNLQVGRQFCGYPFSH